MPQLYFKLTDMYIYVLNWSNWTISGGQFLWMYIQI